MSIKNDKKKVLMVGSSLGSPGGITAVVKSLMQSPLFTQWNVIYVAAYTRPGLLSQLQTFGTALATITGEIIGQRVGLVHVHSASRGSFWRKSIICAMARMFRIPYVFHIHSGEFPEFYARECGTVAQRWVRSILRHASRVLVLTSTWQRQIKAIEAAANISIVPNAIPRPSRFSAQRNIGTRVVFLGRLREKKGVFDLLKAVPEILRIIPAARFVLAGDGELDLVRSEAAKLGIEQAIELPGWVDGEDKDALLRGADVLVLPSYFEGFPVCILEAMAARVPIVATRVGGIPDVLDQGACGLLVEPGDVSGLTHALIRALQDDALRVQLVDSAFRRFEGEYSLEHMAERMSEVYADVLDR